MLRSWAHRQYKNIQADQHPLRYLFLEITQLCNLSCLHCGSDCTSKPSSKELTTESWLKILDYFQETFPSDLNIILTGGEPLVHPELPTLVKKLQQMENPWGMVSNGMLLDQEKLSLLEEGRIHAMTISLDGLAQNHDWLRDRRGSFQRVLEALELLGNSNVPVKDVVSCIFPSNLGDLDALAQVLLDQGITSWRLYRIFPSGRALENQALQLDATQTGDLLRWISENRDRNGKAGLKINYSCEGYVPMKVDKSIRDEPFHCWSGVNIASILADGTITGCSNNPRPFHVGNILQDNFAQLWEKNFGKFRDRSWSRVGPCKECKEWKDCQGSSIHLWHHPEKAIDFCYLNSLPKKL